MRGFATTATFNLDQNIDDNDFGYRGAMTDDCAILTAPGAKKAFIFKKMLVHGGQQQPLT